MRSGTREPPHAVRYLDCPYHEKDRAKGLGARWSPAQKKWYIDAEQDPAPFARWLGRSSSSSSSAAASSSAATATASSAARPRPRPASGPAASAPMASLSLDGTSAAEAAAVEVERSHQYHNLLVDCLPCVLRNGQLRNKDLLVAVAVSSRWRECIERLEHVPAGRTHISRLRHGHPPFFVDIANGDDTAAGSRAAPLKTVDRAETLLRHRNCPPVPKELAVAISDHCPVRHGSDGVDVYVTCSHSTCSFLHCRSCSARFCVEHGIGHGHLHDSDAAMCFCVVKCKATGCRVAFCSQHARQMLTCENCESLEQMHRDLGTGAVPGDVPYVCSRHAQRCKECGCDDDDDDYYSDDGEECRILCCPGCIDNHACSWSNARAQMDNI